MNTFNIQTKMKAICLVLFLSIFSITGFAQVWQWSVPLKGSIRGGAARAYMWIPPSATKVRAMVLGQNNMEELSIIENAAFRDSMASVNMGVIWVSPAFDINFNFTEGAGDVFTQLMNDLADSSGYLELRNVPIVPIGHSAAASFPFMFAAWSPQRTLCAVSVSGTLPYDFTYFLCGRSLDYIPLLTCKGEFEGGGDVDIASRRAANPHLAVSSLGISGEFHFATSDRKNKFIASYIKKAVKYRLATDATSTALATLNPIDPATNGWVSDRWRVNVRPRYPRAAVAAYTGPINETYWCFDEDMAKQVEDIQNKYFGKTPCLIAYNQTSTKGVVGPQVPQNSNHVQCALSFYPLNDSLDFELSSSFLRSIPALSPRCQGWMKTIDTVTQVATTPAIGTVITAPLDTTLSEIVRTIGPFTCLRKDATTGITTFRMTLERGLATYYNNYNQTAIFSVTHPGDSKYKASVLQAEVYISVRNTGTYSQTITFPQLPNVSDISTPVALTATSDRGLPVQYFVREGPAQVVYTSAGAKLKFTQIPPGTKYPMKVTVVAWQWGRDAGLAARIAAPSPLPGQTVSTATPVENTFYITNEKQLSTITWANPVDIAVGTPLSAIQLNATVTGTTAPAVYDPAIGTVLTGGTHTLTVTYAADDNFSGATKTVTIHVNKLTPSITWNNPADITYGTALSATQLNASSSVAGSFVYSPAATTVLNAGTAQVLTATFTPTDAATYAVVSKTVNINVNKASPSIIWSNPADISYGTALSATQLNATSPVTGSFVYTPVVGTVLNAGNAQVLSATFTPTDILNYSATSMTVNITVTKVPLTVTANDTSIVAGASLPVFRYTFTGFVAGDGKSVISGIPAITTTAVSTFVEGTYDINIQQGTLSAANYSFATFTRGTLTITHNVGVVAMEQTGVEVYPNPVTGTLNVVVTAFTKTSYLRVVSLGGVVLISKNIESQQTQVDFSKLPGGTYFVYIVTPSGVVVKQVNKM
jgi:hypothetical protein